MVYRLIALKINILISKFIIPYPPLLFCEYAAFLDKFDFLAGIFVASEVLYVNPYFCSPIGNPCTSILNIKIEYKRTSCYQ